MSHGIESTDSLMLVRKPAWHGLGTVLKRRPRSLNDALAKSGLDWRVDQRPVHIRTSGRYREVPGVRANVRNDTGDVLGIVSDRYVVVQNREAFSFLAALLGTDLAFETAGSLHGGRRVFVTCRLAEVPYLEVGGDQVDLYCNYFNRHDGTGAVQTLTTPIRTVCRNTWDAAVGRAANRYSIRHVGNPSLQIAEARTALKLSLDYGRQFKKWGDRLARQKIAERKVLNIARQLWPDEGSDRQVRNAQRRREAVAHLFLEGATIGNAPGTKWCAANAFVEHIEWDTAARGAEGRLLRHFDDPGGMKRRALDLVATA